MDPYVIFKMHDFKFTSKVHKNGGINPIWNDRFEVTVSDPNAELEFCVMDKNIISDDNVGRGLIKLSSLCTNNGARDWFSLLHKEKIVGQIFLECNYSAGG